eukprot:m.95833 g.95833  ORF g.95833 m.95833 type:complete len:474 (-) comp13913_c0_seq1:130-1551(-)
MKISAQNNSLGYLWAWPFFRFVQMSGGVRDLKLAVAASRKGESPARDMERAKTPAAGFHLDPMLEFIDPTYVNEWLQRTNEAVCDLQAWWADADNSATFSHFWLSELPDSKRTELLEMEVDLFKEEVALAFKVGLEQGSVTEQNLAVLFRATLWEHPQLVLEDHGRAFLDTIAILARSKEEAFRGLLARVKCSTANPTYSTWLLAIRSFGLITLAAACVHFFRNVSVSDDVAADLAALSTSDAPGAAAAAAAASVGSGAGARTGAGAGASELRLSLSEEHGASAGPRPAAAAAAAAAAPARPSTSSGTRPMTGSGVRPGTAGGLRPGTAAGARPTTAAASRTNVAAVDELFASIKLGHVEVVARIAERGGVPPGLVDGLGRTPLLVAVVHRRVAVAELLLTHALCDINQAAASGNTPLQVAVNMGDAALVRLLLLSGADADLRNATSGATARDMAALHDNQEITALLANPPSS